MRSALLSRHEAIERGGYSECGNAGRLPSLRACSLTNQISKAVAASTTIAMMVTVTRA